MQFLISPLASEMEDWDVVEGRQATEVVLDCLACLVNSSFTKGTGFDFVFVFVLAVCVGVGVDVNRLGPLG